MWPGGCLTIGKRDCGAPSAKLLLKPTSSRPLRSLPTHIFSVAHVILASPSARVCVWLSVCVAQCVCGVTCGTVEVALRWPQWHPSAAPCALTKAHRTAGTGLRCRLRSPGIRKRLRCLPPRTRSHRGTCTSRPSRRPNRWATLRAREHKHECLLLLRPYLRCKSTYGTSRARERERARARRDARSDRRRADYVLCDRGIHCTRKRKRMA